MMKMAWALTVLLSLTLTSCNRSAEAPAQQATGQSSQPEASGGDMTPASVDVVEAASADGNLDTFLQAATEAGLGETLAQADGVTIFAPIDEAFEAVGNLDQLLQDKEQLASILKRHAVPTKYLANEIPNGETEVQTLSGETLTIINNDGLISVRSAGGIQAMVVEADIEGDNGVVHSINTVLAE